MAAIGGMTQGAAPAAPLSAKQWWTIILLSALYVVSIVDRTIPSVIIGPLKAAFNLTDMHIGLLLGTAFGIVYSLLGPPAARVVDRGNRKNLIFLGVTVWCLATIGSALAPSFAVLMLMRLGLAAGECILTPAGHSMIGDLVPPESRSLAASIFQAAALVGPPIAFFGGGMMLDAVDGPDHIFAGLGLQGWQAVLILVGAPGLVLGVLFGLTVREPGRPTSAEGGHASATMALVLRQATAHRRLYTGLLVAVSLPAAVAYAFTYWSVELMQRSIGWTAKEAGVAYALVSLVGGVAGALLAPWLTRWLKAAGRSDYLILACLIFTALGILGLSLGPLQNQPAFMMVLLCLGLFGQNGLSANIIVSMQEIAPDSMRGTFVAILFTIMSLVGLGIGPVAAPMIASLLSPDEDMLGQGLAILAIACMGGSALFLLWIRNVYCREAVKGFPAVTT